MLLNFDVVELWEKEVSKTSSIKQYRKKVNEYVKKNNNIEIKEALNEKRLVDFIFEDNGKAAKPKYNALQNFYVYVYEKILNINEYSFPIKHNDVKKFDENKEHKKKRRKYTTEYLHDDFDFAELFNNKYYNHLDNNIATITIKAVLSCALSTGFGSGELLKDYDKNKYLTIEDVKIVKENQVEIQILNSLNINKIILVEEIAEYIIEYINIRNIEEEKTWGKKRSEGKEAFFIKLWEGRKLNIDWNVWNEKSKPSTIYHLVSYMLKYICSRLKIKEISLNDIRSNMVYHTLLSSKGSALNEIVKLHGYAPFVEEAYQRYINKFNNKESMGFDFFHKASLHEVVDGNLDNEVISETYMTESERKRRNQKIVKELKALYKNKCQVCGKTIDLGNGIMYSEVHHIQPLGNQHNGVDNKSNMLVLCPNHHKMFDLGILSIDPIDSRTLLHINCNDNLDKKKIEFKHLVSNVCIRYDYEHIYLNLVKKLGRKI